MKAEDVQWTYRKDCTVLMKVLRTLYFGQEITLNGYRLRFAETQSGGVCLVNTNDLEHILGFSTDLNFIQYLIDETDQVQLNNELFLRSSERVLLSTR